MEGIRDAAHSKKAAVTYDVLYLLLCFSILGALAFGGAREVPSCTVSAGLLFTHIVAAAGCWCVGSFFQCIHIAF
jgi:hypothetical protein